MLRSVGVNLHGLGENPPIPELPKSKEELGEWARKDIETVYIGDFTSEFGGECRPGGIAVSSVKLRCPFCTMIFSGTRREGCLGGSVAPHNCPNCAFPDNITGAYLKLLAKEREGKE